MQTPRQQPRNPGKVIQHQDPSIRSQSKTQKCHKDEIQSLSTESVHESKILAHVAVECLEETGHWTPPHEFVTKQQDGKEDHVKGQEGFAEVVFLVDLVATATAIGVATTITGRRDARVGDGHFGQDSEGGHQYRESHVEQAETAQEASSLSADGSLSVLAMYWVVTKGVAKNSCVVVMDW